MNNVINIESLTKKYKDFLLDHISFSVPSGYRRHRNIGEIWR
jgi:ABC-type multidrug transport system ATPase subunit